MGKKVGTILCCLLVGVLVGAAGAVVLSGVLDIDFKGLIAPAPVCEVTLPQGGEAFSAAASSENPSQIKKGDTYTWTVTLEEGYDRTAPKVIFRDSENNVITPDNFIAGAVIDGTVTYSFKVTQAVKIEIEPQMRQWTVTAPQEHPQRGYEFVSEEPSVDFGGTYTFKVTLDDGYSGSPLTVRANGTVIPDVVNNVTKTIVINEDTVITVDALTVNTYRVTRPAEGSGFTVVDASHGTNAAGIAYGTKYSFTVQLAEWYSNEAPVFTGTTAGITPILNEAQSNCASGKYVYSFNVTQPTEIKISTVANTFDVLWPAGVTPLWVQEGATTDEIQEVFNAAAEQDLPFEKKWVSFENSNKTEDGKGTVVYEVNKTLVIPDNINIAGNGATLKVCVDSVTGEFTRLPSYGALGKEFAILNFGLLNGFMDSSIDKTFSVTNLNFEKHMVTFTPGDGTVYPDGYNPDNLPPALFALGYCRDVTITGCSFVCAVDESYDKTTDWGDTVFDAYTSYQGLTLKGCTFKHETDAATGGVWIRNYAGTVDAKDVLIEDCEFYKRAGDEMLAIWSSKQNASSSLREVTVRNNKFFFATSEHNNPVFCLGIAGGTEISGPTSDVLFTGNYVEAEDVETLLYIGGTQSSARRITVSDNTFVVKGLLGNSTVSNGYLIRGASHDSDNCIIKDNTFTVDSKNTQRRTAFVTGSYLELIGNTIKSENNTYAFDIAAVDVKRFEGNTVERCTESGRNVEFFVNNIIESCTMFYRAYPSGGDALNRRQYTVTGNVFYTPDITQSVTIMVSAACDITFANNSFYNLTDHNTIINTNLSTDSVLIFRRNTFYNKAANKLVISLGETPVNVAEWKDNKLLGEDGVDLLHNTSPGAITPNALWSGMPVGSTVLFNVKKGTQTGWTKTDTGWVASPVPEE